MARRKPDLYHVLRRMTVDEMQARCIDDSRQHWLYLTSFRTRKEALEYVGDKPNYRIQPCLPLRTV